MSKTLILMRHAEDDFRGNLSEDGERQAHSIAHQLLQQNLVPDVIYHSPEERAEKTALVLLETFHEAGHEVASGTKADPALFNKGVRTLAQDLTENLKTVIMVSHAPDLVRGLEEMRVFCGRLRHATTIVLSSADDQPWREMCAPSGRKTISSYIP